MREIRPLYMGIFARAARRVAAVFEQRPSGAVRAESYAMPIATRTWRELTPDDALSALQQAQSGNIRLACDFCDALLTDDRIPGILDVRVLGMLGLPQYFEGATLPNWYALAPENELARLLTWGLLLGVGFARIRADGALEWWHSRNFDYDRFADQWYVTTSEGREPISRCAGEWVIFEPYGRHDSSLAGLWVSLALPLLIKLFSLHDRARASEVFGSAMIVGTASEGSTEPQRRKWLSDLKALARNSRVVLPDADYKIDILEAQGQTWGIYQQAIEWADNAITIRIAGQLVTTNGSGAFSRGDVHEKIARSLLRFGEAVLSSCLATQYVPCVWGVKSTPRWQTASPDELIGEGMALEGFAKGAAAITPLLAGTGKELDLDAYCKRFGVLTRPATKPTALPAPTPILGPPTGKDRLIRMAASGKLRPGYEKYAATVIPDAPRREFRIFKMGANVTDYGIRYYTRESARRIMTAQGNRDVVIDLEHLSLNQDALNYDPDARGHCRLQARKDGLWAVNVRWTADGLRRINARKQRGISPVSYHRKSDNVIVALHNLALTAQPATHDGVVLIAASRGRMPKLLEMLGLPSDASVEDILKALGLDSSASAEDTLNAIAKAFEAAGASDEGAADDGAGASDDAPPPEAASKPAVKPAAKPVKASATQPDIASRLSALEKSDETRERNSLIGSRAFKPWELDMLSKAPIETVRTYVQNASAPADKKPGATTKTEATNAIEVEALAAVAKATGLSKAVIAEYAKKGTVSNG